VIFLFPYEVYPAVKEEIDEFVEGCSMTRSGWMCSIDLMAVWNKIDEWVERGIPFFGWVGRIRARSKDREWYSYLILKSGVEGVDEYVEMFKKMGLDVVEREGYIVVVGDLGTWCELFKYITSIPNGGVVGYGLGKYIV